MTKSLFDSTLPPPDRSTSGARKVIEAMEPGDSHLFVDSTPNAVSVEMHRVGKRLTDRRYRSRLERGPTDEPRRRVWRLA